MYDTQTKLICESFICRLPAGCGNDKFARSSNFDLGHSEKRVYRPAAVSLDRAGKILCSFIK